MLKHNMILVYFIIVQVLSHTTAVQELLQNGDFESSTGGWHCSDCRLAPSSDRFHGQHSGQVTNRHHVWSSVRQTVTIRGGHRYILKGYFKLLNMASGKPYVFVELMAGVRGNGHTQYKQLASLPMQQMSHGWTEIGGDYTAPSGAESAEIYIQIHDTSINYLQDYFSVQELPTNDNWKSEAHERINQMRKATITIGLQGASSDDFTAELVQLKHDFAFGTAVFAPHITDPNYKHLQEFVYTHFEWATLKNFLKWRIMEWTKGHINFHTALNAINELLSHGMKVRGHNMFWGVNGHIPAWLDGMSQSELVAEMKTHVNQMISHTKGKLQHWDVNNENLHGDYFEQHTGDANITEKMFGWIHDLEPSVDLFINDYEILMSSHYTTSVKNQALRYLSHGVPLAGVGLQSHFRNSYVDMTTLKYRLDKVAEAGLPIWITELTLHEPNENKKADLLEDILTLYFSHPAVKGIILWGFWDGSIHDVATSLFTGPNITGNAAGQRYLKLFHHDWSTNEVIDIQHGSTSRVSAFLGDYELNIKHNNKVVHVEHFTLDQAGKQLTVHLQDDQHVSHIAFG